MKVRNPRVFRPVFLAGLLLIVSSALVAYGLALSQNEVFSVASATLQVHGAPSTSAPSLFLLRKGAHVFSLEQGTSVEPLQWMKIAFLHRPPGRIFLERLEGWAPGTTPAGGPSLRPENLLGESLAVRYLYKWRVQSLVRLWIQQSKLLKPLKAFLPSTPDKTLHILLMFLLALATFLLLVVGTSLSPFAAVLTTLVATNLLGLANELLDLYTGMGSFERMDLAANAIGSAGLLVLVSIRAVCRRMRDRWAASGPRDP